MTNQDFDLEKLKSLIKESGLSKKEIVRRAGIDYASLWRILKGQRKLSSTTLKKLAPVFGVSVAYFFNSQDYPTVVREGVLSAVLIPLHHGLECFSNEAIIEERDMSMAIPTPRDAIRRALVSEDSCFWCEATGELFSPRINPGDQVLFSKGPIRHSDLVIAVIETDKGIILVLKRYMAYGDTIKLIPELSKDEATLEISKQDIESKKVRIYKVIRISVIP